MGDAPIAAMSVASLVAGYREGDLSPVEVASAYLERIKQFNGELNAFVQVNAEEAMQQAVEAESLYASGDPTPPLLGVPTSVKDAFHMRGLPTTIGSLVHQGQISKNDSGVVRRLRAAGAVFTGKTNTAEFGQSATTDNLLGSATGNPWDPRRTPGGSSGGAAASVAAGLSAIAVGSDGGGSVRIPAAFTGIYGFKPSPGRCPDEKGFRAMTDFVSAGPMTNSVADARILLGVLSETAFPRTDVTGLRVAYCRFPEGRAVDPGVAAAVQVAANTLGELGHEVIETDLPLEGWNDVFGPLVLEDEHRERGHLLTHVPNLITGYERSTLRAALRLDPAEVERAQALLPEYRRRIDELFERYDLLLTPTVAVPAFPLGERPTHVAGVAVDQLWGAFPFAVPFNVAGVAAASLPCGLAAGMPVGAQLVARSGAEQLLLDASESLEEALAFDRAALRERWRLGRPVAV